MLKKPVVSVPSSGRPSCETTVVTSGNDMKTWRIRVAQLGAVLERDRERHRRARPDVALFELGQELAAEQREQVEAATAASSRITTSVSRGHRSTPHEQAVVEAR